MRRNRGRICRLVRAGAGVLGLILGAGCGGDRTGVLVDVVLEEGVAETSTVTFSWLDRKQFLFRDRAVFTANPSGRRSLGTVFIEVDERGGERRLIGRATRNGAVVLEGAARATVSRGMREVTLSLRPGPLPDLDGDGIPDVIDNCPREEDATGGCRPVDPAELDPMDGSVPMVADADLPAERAAGGADAGVDGRVIPVDARVTGPDTRVDAVAPDGRVTPDVAPPPPPPPLDSGVTPDAGPPPPPPPPMDAAPPLMNECRTPAGSCPSGLPYGFETSADGFSPGEAFGRPRTSCERTYCGVGALVVEGSLAYPGARLGKIERTLSPTQNLLGKTVTAHVYVDAYDKPMNAHVYYIDRNGYFKMVTWRVLSRGWNTISAVVNEPTADVARKLGVEVYLAVENTTWSGRVYFDEIGWK